MQLETEGECHLVVTRCFAKAQYRAHTEPELIRDVQPGGKLRYEWSDDEGTGFLLTGEFITHGISRGGR